METTIRSAHRTVIVSSGLPFVIIGEKINPTGRSKLADALQTGDYHYITELAQKQVAAGADILDINIGVPGLDEVKTLPEVAKIVAKAVDVPLCLDSANPDALAATLAALPGRPLVNSVSGEEKSLSAVLPVVKAFNVPVIGLVMDDNGIPTEARERLVVAEKIINRAAQIGIPVEDIIIDPLVLTVGADSNAALVTLDTIRMVSQSLKVNINLGASNVSFGLPDRQTINQAFLALAMGAGATCAITDPIQLTPTIRAADLLLGRDSYGTRYIRHWRKQ